eukprot:2672748-Prymnesium_polylepis.1
MRRPSPAARAATRARGLPRRACAAQTAAPPRGPRAARSGARAHGCSGGGSGRCRANAARRWRSEGGRRRR